MNRAFFCFCILLFSIGARAQTYTLQQCIDSALKNDIPVQQSALTARAAEINLKQSRNNLLPDVNANINHGINSGRSIDPFTNTYVNQSVNTASYGLSSGIIIFNGLNLQSLIRQNMYAYDASRMELQQKKDELVLTVIAAYLDALNAEDQLQLAFTRALNSQKNFERLQTLNNLGAIKPSDLSDLKGEMLGDQVGILDARASLENFKLALARLMNVPYDSTMRIEHVEVGEYLTMYESTANQIYQNSLGQFAHIKAVELRTRSRQYSVKAARGLMYPRLTFGAGINTTYSSVAENAGTKIPYSSQLKNNRFSSVGLGLNIPIFNGMYARNRVKLAELDLKDAALTEENTKRQLRKDIEEAYLKMVNAYDRYKLLLDQVNAYAESFKAADVRFSAGVGTSYDYLVAKAKLDQANINLLNAKYGFVFRKKILDYYNGKP
ncbi:MAG TPA: TolC family protein [Flavisolibacter sp.]|nr:TolC family protein [Flavisolibacter sp.]